MRPIPIPRTRRPGHFSDQAAFTLVEMLIAVAITLIMMAAVVTMFANITNSVRNRRATIEMSGQLRHVRNMLQQDLLAATCPGITWQKPDSNHGYIELIEGVYRDSNPSIYTDGDSDTDRNGMNDELDAKLSAIPRNNAVSDTNGNGRIDDEEIVAHLNSQPSLNGLNGLGDYDDILMFTARNEHEHYVGRVPDYTNPNQYISGTSPVAEIIWYAIENPSQAENDLVGGFFGEPGMRTIYRRALLVLPTLQPLGPAQPNGVLQINTSLAKTDVAQALAWLINFQDTYDVSARLEWDALANGGAGHWKILANTLADLTKRENRFMHYGFIPGGDRAYPFPIVSMGTGYSSSNPVSFTYENGSPHNARATGYALSSALISYVVQDPGTTHIARPFAFVRGNSGPAATANAMMDDDGRVVRVLHGPVPLAGLRRGQDVMLTNVLGFDLKVFDPGAPIYQALDTTQSPPSPIAILEPSDPGWSSAYHPQIGTTSGASAAFVGQGSYVDMGYGFIANIMTPAFVPAGTNWILPWFANARALSHIGGGQLAPGYAVYDTWSTSYENNGIDEDGDGLIDEGTNGLDDPGFYLDGVATRLGPDDVGERETRPPYDKPLRGVQVVLRVYETDARQIRQVRVNQHFLGE